MGVTKSGPFDVAGELARQWLAMPNPHGRPNAEILYPSLNGQDLARRPSGDWIINFGNQSESDASLYEAPYTYAVAQIKPKRLESRTDKNRRVWWLFERARPEMFAAIGGQPRYIATCLVSKHRFFVWQHARTVPENVVIVIARSDDTTFGILHSRFHELWALRLGTSLEDRPRYTPSTTFETFPFPAGMTPADTAAGAPEARRPRPSPPPPAGSTNCAATGSTPPTGWTGSSPRGGRRRLPRAAGGPPRPRGRAQKRTLTNLYNQRPAWLANAHQALDQAVAVAYGWSDYSPAMADDEILRRLLKLNLERA
jgi:hypothetical protein